MIALDVTTILGNKTKPWFHVCQLNVRREDAASFFDVEPVVADEPGLGDADYWAVRFDCGLELGVEFFHLSEGASVYADLPCAQHVRRHLRHWDRELVDVPPDMFAPDREAMIERFADQNCALLELDAFQVWRQGDDGNQVKIGIPTTKRDADCWVAEFGSHHHKQIYWVSRCVNAST
ncbi:hypothetical protein NHH03_01560 [Stieleria sp. TO1_6]|nr:hypothetical protein [Stieleria tagensis]